MAMCLDGHVAHPTEAWEFGSAEDRRRMDRLREWADCLIVSRKTLEHDNMNLTVRTKPHAKKHPHPVIVMQSARPLKSGLRVTKSGRADGEVWIAGSTGNISITELWPDLGQDWKIYTHQNVRDIVTSLQSRGLTKILLEGGPTLNGLFFSEDLIDEFFITILPLLWAGTTTDRTVITPAAIDMKRFTLKSAEKRKNEMFLRYLRNRRA